MPLPDINAFDPEAATMWNPHMHTKVQVMLPYGKPGCMEPFERFNQDFDRWLTDAYLPIVPEWCPNDNMLACYLDPYYTEYRTELRKRCGSCASRIYQSVRIDKTLVRWKALSQAKREELILKWFKIEALDAVKHKHPYSRQHAPELVLSNLLRGNGQGFAELCEALCWVPSERTEREIGEGNFPILPNAQWERLVGMKQGIVQSRPRRAFIEFALLLRHMALYRIVDRVLAELWREGDQTPNVAAWTPPKGPRCRLCSKDLIGPKPLLCSRCKEKGKREVYYCSKEHQVQDWKTGHKRICGKPNSEIEIASSFPTAVDRAAADLQRTRELIDKHSFIYWVTVSDGREVGVAIGGAAFAPEEKEAASAEIRQVALQACDSGDEVSVGLVALMLDASARLNRVDPAEQRKNLERVMKLGEGDEGRKAREAREDKAWEKLDAGEYPSVRRMLQYIDSGEAAAGITRHVGVHRLDSVLRRDEQEKMSELNRALDKVQLDID
ncbi:hypothetical protein JCM10213_008631 [Rhodosporidiobolus nylandii]